MYYKDLTHTAFNGTTYWVVSPQTWSHAKPDDIALALVDRVFHYAPTEYVSPNAGQEKIVSKLCEAIGTNYTRLRNSGFGVALSFIPRIEESAGPQQEMSLEFMKKVASQLLTDERKVHLMNALKVTLPKSSKKVSRLMRGRTASLAISVGFLCGQLTKSPQTTEEAVLGALPAVLTLLAQVALTIMYRREMRKTDSLIAELDNHTFPEIRKMWTEEALQHDIKVQRLIIQTLSRSIDDLPQDGNQELISVIIEAAERSAEALPFKFPFVEFVASSTSLNLGSTAIKGLIISPGPKPPFPPSHNRKESKIGWSYGWLDKLARHTAPKPA